MIVILCDFYDVLYCRIFEIDFSFNLCYSSYELSLILFLDIFILTRKNENVLNVIKKFTGKSVVQEIGC